MPLNLPKLERLYDAHAAGLFLYLVTFTKSDTDARDLLQDVFIRLARLDAMEQQTNEKAFVFRIAHNLAVDWLRRRIVRQESEESLAREIERNDHSAPDPDMPLLASHFAAALRSLPEDQRSVAQLRLWGGLTFEEIAHTQNIPLNTAASRYRYALDKLRTLLRPIYEELT
jgi:RNA polymerase sigma-70 factor (ECF subfamily)